MASVKDTGKSIATHTKQYVSTLQHDQFPKVAGFAKTTAFTIRVVAKGAAIGAKEAKRALDAKRQVEKAGSHAADTVKESVKGSGELAKGALAKAGDAARSMARSERRPEEAEKKSAAEKHEEPGKEDAEQKKTAAAEKPEERGREGAEQKKTAAAEKPEERGKEGAEQKKTAAPPSGQGGQRAIGEALQGAAASARREIEKGRTNIRQGATQTAEAARDAGANIKEQLGGAKEQFGGAKEQPTGGGQRRPDTRGGAESNRPAEGGYLGMTTFPVDLPEKFSEEFSTRRGLMVLGVEPDGPADEAGIQMGDTLLTLDDDPLSEIQDLVAHLPPDRIGQEVHAKVLRAGAAQDIALKVGSKRPSSGSQQTSSYESEAHPG